MTTYLQNNWGDISLHYEKYHAQIMSSKPWQYAIDPYEWDRGLGMIHMTPIEEAMWSDIRCSGLVMYPQWPQCDFFLDFANPVARVAIECDGREFHDSVKDGRRDAILEAEGWTVYRMTGRDCLRLGEENEDGHYIHSPGEKLCQLIKQRHCAPDDDETEGVWVDAITAAEEHLLTILARMS